MSNAISIHIGLNQVDPACYNGWSGTLSGCINDAVAMKAIAESLGYTTMLLTDGNATSDRVIEALGRASQQLSAGDILLLTYSGHGGQVRDVNGDDQDGRDETWVLYDRMLVDDELWLQWSHFAAGVRIFVLSDSCHSGTVTRMRQYQELYLTPARQKAPVPRWRAIPDQVAQEHWSTRRALYSSIQWASAGSRANVDATVLLISGCQDSQLSADGDVNGLFTQHLLEVWNDGAFSGNYRRFWQEIGAKMPPDQTPNYSVVGATNLPFENQRPFSCEPTANAGTDLPTQPGRPSVSGPASWARGGGAPVFDVNPGSNPYYIFEITSRPELLDIAAHGTERTDSNFYGSWGDGSVPSRLTNRQFQLPEAAWQRLRAAEALYFRIGTTSSSTGWDNYTVSTADSQAASAPVMRISDSIAPSPQPPLSPPTQPGHRTLRRGDRGEDVRELQSLLVGRGFPTSVDGVFGPGTDSSVRAFQRSCGLSADGVVGPATWSALGARASIPATATARPRANAVHQPA